METEPLKLAVIMQRKPLASDWQPYQWKPLEISLDLLPALFPNAASHCLCNDEADTRWLFAGLEIKLYRDEAEGYFLNVDAPTPCWFVMWRMEERDGSELAVPKCVTLSYNEAARLMDGGEQVDAVPCSAAIVERLRAFVQQHYRPEPKGKRRKPSFEGGAAVEQIAQGEGHER